MIAIKFLLQLLFFGVFLFFYYFLVDQEIVSLGLYAAGLGLGVGILLFDEMYLIRYYDSLQFDGKQLISRSFLFLLAYFPIAIFVVTSAPTAISLGVVHGLGLSLSLDLFFWRGKQDEFQKRFLWQVRRQFSQSEIDAGVLLFMLMNTLILLLSFT